MSISISISIDFNINCSYTSDHTIHYIPKGLGTLDHHIHMRLLYVIKKIIDVHMRLIWSYSFSLVKVRAVFRLL